MSWRHRRAPQPRRTLAPAIVVAIVVALPGLVALSTASSAGAAAAPQSYIALGDSYTSGPLIPNQLANPLGCLRSDHNYPHLVAPALALTLTDVSCSGATTADMTSPQSTSAGTNPPQLSAVGGGTSVVSLGIGGNDIGFVSIIENSAALTPFGPTKVGMTCQSFYDPGGNDRIAAAIAATGPKVGAVLTQIHRQASSAKVFVVGYPAILPPAGTGCWPQMPLTLTDVPYLRHEAKLLNAMLRSQAALHGAIYVDTYDPGRTMNACMPPGARWIEPVVPVAPAAPVHPNAAGEAGMAGVLETSMVAAGIS